MSALYAARREGFRAGGRWVEERDARPRDNGRRPRRRCGGLRRLGRQRYRSRRPDDALRHPGRRLPRIRPRNGRRPRGEPATARHRDRPLHRSGGMRSRGRREPTTGRCPTASSSSPGCGARCCRDALRNARAGPTAARGPNVAPLRGADFARFAGAAAERYPFVHRWTIWNEPNQRRWLSTASPTQYVTRLLNPAYAAIHGASPDIPGRRRCHGSPR